MFNEANSVEDYVRDLLCGKQDSAVGEPLFKGASLPGLAAGLGWRFIPADQLPRDFNDVLVEAHLREALIRLNPEIAEKPDRADEVIYKLRAILLSVQSDGRMARSSPPGCGVSGPCPSVQTTSTRPSG